MFEATLRLYVVTLVVGVAAYPLARRVLGSQAGTAWGAARYLGTLPALFLLWMALQAGPGRLNVVWSWVTVLVIAAAIWLHEWRAGRLRQTTRAIADVEHWRHEVVFVVLLVTFSWVLHFNPAIDPDSERYMDYALLEAVVTAEDIVVEDPWFAGEPLQYYYFGYYWVAMVMRLAGVDGLTGFVPVIALLYALFGQLLFSIGRSLRGRAGDGVFAVVLVLFCGNLQSFLGLLDRATVTEYDWFSPSRVIPGTINEFPFFSLLYGDLHPYVIGFPLFALVVLLAHRAYLEGSPSLGAPRFWCTALAFGLSASVNSWDFPVAAMLYGIALYLHGVSHQRSRRGAITVAAAAVIAVVVIGVAPFLPYLVLSQSAGRTLAWVEHGTRWLDYLRVHGTHWVLLCLCAAATLAAGRSQSRLIVPLGGLLAVVVSTAFAGVLGGAAAACAIAWILAERSPADGAARLGWGMVAVAMLMTAAVETLHVDDLFAGEYERVVTVFKVYLQTWITLGVGSVILLTSAAQRWVWARRTVVAGVLVVGLVYPVVGTAARIRSLGDAHRLTTRQHLEAAMGPEWEAFVWLAANARAGDVVLEAPGPPYTWSGRMATFTPAATPLAWDYHQATWRDSLPLIRQREALVDRAFSTTDLDESARLLEEFGVRFVMLGRLERTRYGDDVGRHFSNLGYVVIEQSGARLLRVLPKTDQPVADQRAPSSGDGST